MKTRQIARWVAALAALALVVAVAWRWGSQIWSLFRDQAIFQAWIASFGAWAPLVSIGLNAAQVIVAFIPGQVISLANGYLFGVAWGILYNLIGTMLGSALIVILTRRWGRPLVTRLVSNHQEFARLDSLVARQGRFFFFLIFLLPSMPKDLACYAAGLTELPVGQMLILIALGRLPGLIVASWVGANAVRFGPVEWIGMIVATCLLGLIYLRWGKTIEETLARWPGNLARK